MYVPMPVGAVGDQGIEHADRDRHLAGRVGHDALEVRVRAVVVVVEVHDDLPALPGRRRGPRHRQRLVLGGRELAGRQLDGRHRHHLTADRGRVVAGHHGADRLAGHQPAGRHAVGRVVRAREHAGRERQRRMGAGGGERAGGQAGRVRVARLVEPAPPVGARRVAERRAGPHVAARTVLDLDQPGVWIRQVLDLRGEAADAVAVHLERKARVQGRRQASANAGCGVDARPGVDRRRVGDDVFGRAAAAARRDQDDAEKALPTHARTLPRTRGGATPVHASMQRAGSRCIRLA
jgi:hypothetical protein